MGTRAGNAMTEKSFILGGRTFNYVNTRGWNKTERRVEVSLGWTFLTETCDFTTLEVGNVMIHHVSRFDKHCIVDLNEPPTAKQKKDGIQYHNENVLDWQPSWRPTSILSISTLEHTGRELDRGMRQALKRVMSWSDRVLVTMPLGYCSVPHPEQLDASHLLDDDVGAQVFLMERLDEANNWRQVPREEFDKMSYEDFRYAQKYYPTASMIAIWMKNGIDHVQ
jgi:hypothetical protein